MQGGWHALEQFPGLMASLVVAGASGAAVYSAPVQDFIKLFSSFQAEQKVCFFRIQQVCTDLNSEHFTHMADSGPYSD